MAFEKPLVDAVGVEDMMALKSPNHALVAEHLETYDAAQAISGGLYHITLSRIGAYHSTAGPDWSGGESPSASSFLYNVGGEAASSACTAKESVGPRTLESLLVVLMFVAASRSWGLRGASSDTLACRLPFRVRESRSTETMV